MYSEGQDNSNTSTSEGMSLKKCVVFKINQIPLGMSTEFNVPWQHLPEQHQLLLFNLTACA